MGIGVVIGSVAMAIILGLIFLIMRKRKGRKNAVIVVADEDKFDDSEKKMRFAEHYYE